MLKQKTDIMDKEINVTYTLEKHLQCIAENEPEFDVLLSVWILNKKQLNKGLQTISHVFPHYSSHDMTHSDKIIRNIQCFLGEKRIKQLGATETFLLLMASLTHDVGMIVTYHIVEEKWSNSEFKTILEQYSQSSDTILADAANKILKFKNDNSIEEDIGFKWALEVKNAVTIITAELFRGRHADMGSDILSSDTVVTKLACGFYLEQLDRRFVDLLAKVAYLHGAQAEDVLNELDKEANGLYSDYIHPRFIAFMIRIGDLLDIDSNRFNDFSIAMIKQMPKESEKHYKKHQSVRHVLISPNAIEVKLDCNDEEVYRISREWFDWLEREIDFLRREWANIISPVETFGLPPVIEKDGIQIYYNGVKPKPEFLNLRFNMGQEKIFDILKGGGLYKEPGLVFIREIIQNAFDAIKLQLWKDIKAGQYPKLNPQDIKFPNDIDKTIYELYEVSVDIEWLDSEEDTLVVRCTDNGIGISEDALLQMSNCVGESYSKQRFKNNDFSDLPYWLKPTAAFGLGLQSIFFVTDSFDVYTHYLGETSKHIVFRSAAKKYYSSIKEENISHSRGTTIEIKIPKDDFPNTFGYRFDFEILNNLKDGDDVFIEKIKHNIYETIFIDNRFQFKCRINKIPIENPNYWYLGEESKFGPINKDNYRIYIYDQNELLIFKIIENICGSSLFLLFDNRFVANFCRRELWLRNMKVKQDIPNFYETSYMGITWNLENQESDKVVDISRDNITMDGANIIYPNLLEKILPNVLPTIQDSFSKGISRDDIVLKDGVTQYINYCLTLYMFQESASNINCNKTFPLHIVEKNSSVVTVSELICADSVVLISVSDLNKISRDKRDSFFEGIIKTYKNNKTLPDNKIILKDEDYFRPMLYLKYVTTDIFVDKKETYQIFVRVLKKKELLKEDELQMVKSHSLNYLKEMESLNRFECTKKILYGIDRYKDVIVKRVAVTGFERFPFCSNCGIFTPFRDDNIAKKFIQDCKNAKNKKFISERIEDYIDDYWINVVVSNNINSKITKDEVKSGYIKLLEDFFEIIKAENENTCEK